MRHLFYLTFALLLLGACKKEETKDCESNNYGVVTINYTNTTNRHSILVTYPGTANFREKITAIGVNSDTLRLGPNTWPLSISSIDNNGAALQSENRAAVVSQCSSETVTINF